MAITGEPQLDEAIKKHKEILNNDPEDAHAHFNPRRADAEFAQTGDVLAGTLSIQK